MQLSGGRPIHSHRGRRGHLRLSAHERPQHRVARRTRPADREDQAAPRSCRPVALHVPARRRVRRRVEPWSACQCWARCPTVHGNPIPIEVSLGTSGRVAVAQITHRDKLKPKPVTPRTSISAPAQDPPRRPSCATHLAGRSARRDETPNPTRLGPHADIELVVQGMNLALQALKGRRWWQGIPNEAEVATLVERRGSPLGGEKAAEDAMAAEAAPPTSRPSLRLGTPKHKGSR